MKLLRSIVNAVLFSAMAANASEIITVVNPQGPTPSGTPQLMAVIEEANKIQNKYKLQN